MLRRRLLGQSGDRLDLPSSLHLAEMDKGDVWNLIVDTGSPSNYAERYDDIPTIVAIFYSLPPFRGKKNYQAGNLYPYKPWF